MGSCMGRCFMQRNPISSIYNSQNNLQNDNEFNFLVDETERTEEKSSFISRILSKKKNRYKKHKKPVLELVEDFLHPAASSYSRLNRTNRKIPYSISGESNRSDIPLQCLDVRALLARSVEPMTSSTPVSSLDLEWEHETLPVSVHDPSMSSWAVLPEETLPELSDASTTKQAGPSSISDWSRVSSADSLEWDPVQSPLHCTPPGSIDADTQQLLHEIELLTDQALRETGNVLTS